MFVFHSLSGQQIFDFSLQQFTRVVISRKKRNVEISIQNGRKVHGKEKKSFG